MHFNLPRVSGAEIGPDGSTDLAVWLFFQIAAGHIALPILVATFLFAKTVPKHPGVLTVCFTWILSGVFSTLLFYVGEHKGPEPSQGLCIAQASLLGAVPMMTCSALLLLDYRIWRTYDGHDVHIRPESRRQKYIQLVIYVIPFIVFGIFVAIAASLALNHPHRVDREQRYFYCSLDWAPFSTAVAVLSALFCFVAAGLEVLIAVKLSRHWHLLRSEDHLTDEKLSLVLRTSIFTSYLLASSMVNLVSIWVPLGVVPDMLSASVGMALFLIFVSRRVILRAWAFWRRSQAADTSMTTNTTLTLPPKRRYRAYRDSLASSSIPTLSRTGSQTLGSFAGRSSQTLTMQDYGYGYSEFKGPGQGVQVIGRPEEAFKHIKIQPDKPRTTISTWGF